MTRSIMIVVNRTTTVGVALVLLLMGSAGSAVDQPAKQDPPQPLPKELVAAWEKAGARSGWMGFTSYGNSDFHHEATELIGAVPAFRFSPGWKTGVVAKLPIPAEPFGLDLRLTRVTDVDLTELVGLSNLHTLGLSTTRVTDTGLKELAGLKSLRILYLDDVKLTDAGVAELRRALPECRISH